MTARTVEFSTVLLVSIDRVWDEVTRPRLLLHIARGYAHGAELPGAANPVAYSVGFVISTGLLHLAGIAVGMLCGLPRGSGVVRGAGVAVATVGGAFLFGVL